MRSIRTAVVLATMWMTALSACSEAAGGDDGTSGSGGTSGASGSAGSSGSSGTSGSAGSAGTAGTAGNAGTAGSSGTAGTSGASGSAGSSGAAGAGSFAVVINEISADKSDFIELFNAGTVSVSLGGYQVADLDDTTGGPKVADAVTIPADFTLAPGAYLVIDANNAAPKDGLVNDCPESGASECLQALFGLSATAGDTAYLLDPQGNVVAQGSLPANGAPKPASWCRLPNGTGDFALCGSTPGAENAAP